MAFRCVGKSKQIEGHKRYQFFYGQSRKRIECHPDVVIDQYRCWESAVKIKLRTRKTMFFEILDEYLEYSSQNKTHALHISEMRHVKIFKAHFTDMHIMDIKRKHIIAYRNAREQHTSRFGQALKPASINRELSTLSFFFSWARTEEYYPAINPCFKVKLKEKNDRFIALAPDEINELLDKAQQMGLIYTAVMLGIHAGLRRNEIFTLKWSNVDFGRSMLILDPENCKGNKGRVVAMNDDLLDHLKQLRRAKPFAEKIFCEWKTLAAFRCQWDNLRDNLSFKFLSNGLVLHLHDLRHLFCGALLDGETPHARIQYKMGHADQSLIQRYGQARPSKLDYEDVNKIPSILGIRRSAV